MYFFLFVHIINGFNEIVQAIMHASNHLFGSFPFCDGYVNYSKLQQFSHIMRWKFLVSYGQHYNVLFN